MRSCIYFRAKDAVYLVRSFYSLQLFWFVCDFVLFANFNVSLG